MKQSTVGAARINTLPLMTIVLVLTGMIWAQYVRAENFDSEVSLTQVKSGNFYLRASLNETYEGEFLLDTGSGYLALTTKAFKVLKRNARPEKVRDIYGVMADGSKHQVSVYRLAHVHLGSAGDVGCDLYDVEAVVIPGATKNILGINALKAASPFAVHTDPAKVMLSNCSGVQQPSQGQLLSSAL